MADISTITVSRKSQELLLAHAKECFNVWRRGGEQRSYMEHIDQDYLRIYRQDEKSIKAEIKMRNESPTKFRNIIYPIVMPAVEAATTYQTSVFCTGTPLFGVVSSPKYAHAAAALETKIDTDATRGGWSAEFTSYFRSLFKYRKSALLVEYQHQFTPAPGGTTKDGRKLSWQGNVVTALDPYNTFFDPLVKAAHLSTKGEFAGTIQRISKIALKQELMSMRTRMTQNWSAAYESSPGEAGTGQGFFTPKLGNTLYGKMVATEFNWLSYLGQSEAGGAKSKLQYYDYIKMFVRLCPKDFGIEAPAASYPQIWRLHIVNWQVVVVAEPVVTEFNTLPILMAEAYEDNTGDYGQSTAEITAPFQQLATAFVNSAVAARRRAISDRAIYNQTLIESKHLLTDDPSAKIPMKPSALLSAKPSDAYYAIPYNDNISGTALQEAEMISGIAQKATRQNPARQGQFVKGNKTRAEYADVMSNANGADQATAILQEARVFTPLKEFLKFNVIQHQGVEALYNRQTREVVQIDPAELQQAVLAFKISDGLEPSSKLADSDTLQVMLQTVPALPELKQEYNVSNIFASILQAGGVDVRDYKLSPEEKMYNQQLAAWLQAAQAAADAGAPFNVPQPVPPQQAQG